MTSLQPTHKLLQLGRVIRTVGCGAASFFIIQWAVMGQTPAFPGAQGFGGYATGGRGGTVYHVTNLNDSGPGSFREAVSVSGRTVVFDVSGVIDYQPPRYNVKNNITIAGQTAPGDGVALYGDGIGFTDADNTITRFIRFRMGHDAVGEDTVGIARGHDMIFDHISATWSLDEVFSISGSPDPTNITIQSSIIGQGLRDHSAGGLIQTDGGVSILRCLYIDNGTRNPKVKGVNEFVNNVIYNWEVAAYILGDSAGPSYANVIGNYFIHGPGSGSEGAFSRGNANFNLFAANNWQDRNRNGSLDGVLLTQTDYDDNTWHTTPYPWPIAVSNALPALASVKLAVSDVGPSWRRDTVDERLITELTSWGTVGETIFSEFDPPMNGPGPFQAGPVPLDTDQDGMPDYWEAALGMATNAPNNNDPGAAGHTKLEEFLNWLAEPHGVTATNTTVDIDLRQFTRGFLDTGPVYSLSVGTNGSVSLLDDHIARFIPDNDFIGLGGFSFTITDSQDSALTRPIGLFFTPQNPAYARLWRGDGIDNNWNAAGDYNWFDEQSLLYPFANGDAVAFDATGSDSPPVNLIGSLQPARVTVDSTGDYIFGGSGTLEGAMPLIKSGTGVLTLANTNNFTGPTTVSNGTLLVHGSLNQSVVMVRAGAVLGGDGQLGIAPVLPSGSVLAPGGGLDSPGSLSIDASFGETGGVLNHFDLSDDPSGTSKTNDQIHVAGDLNLSGANTLEVNLLDGPLANGLYKLFTYSGNLNGSLSSLTLIGANGMLTNPPGAIAIYVDNTRPPASLVWDGNDVNNNWDDGVTPDWRNGALPDWFYFGDSVLFNDSGSSSPAIDLVGTLSPAAVTVDATRDYTFGGAGRISGTGGLTKTNSGTLTIATANDYTGVTTLAGGVLSVASLPNGGTPGSIGAASTDPANLVFEGGILQLTGGSDSTDRGASIQSGGGTIEVTSVVTVLTLNGTLIGPGAISKTGPGRVDVDAANSYSGGTLVNAGDVRMLNTAGFGSGPLDLNGTTNSATFRFGSDAQTLPNKLTVTGPDNHVLIRGNNTLSQIDGDGTFTGGLVDSGTTLTFGGNMTAFTGTFHAGTVANPRFHGSTGSSIATFDLGNGSAKLNNRNGNLTANIGALIGGPNTVLEGASSANSATTYVIGGNNLSTTFAGRIQEVIPARGVAITKVGAGTLTLTGANTYNGLTTINAGTLLVNNSNGTGTGTNSVTVNAGGTLGGTGLVHGPVVVNTGGGIAPGDGIGTLTLRGNLTLNAGSHLTFELGSPAASDKLAIAGSLALNGTLDVVAQPGFVAGTYTVMTYGGSLSGTPPVVGGKPAGYAFTVNTGVAGQVRLMVAVRTPPVISSVQFDSGNLVLNGSGPVNEACYILGSTNAGLPVAAWTRLYTNQFNSGGVFAFTNPVIPGTPEMFFRLRLP